MHKKILKNFMNEFDLQDIWRENNIGRKRFTWKGPNNLQARLDYFLVSSDLLPFVNDCDIGIKYKSDHSPVAISFKFIKHERGRGNWKFNNSLLNDIEYVKTIKSCIAETITQYSNNDPENNFTINDQLLWETLKIMIRGKTISYCSFKKRELNKEEEKLETKIDILQRESNPNQDILNRLSNNLKEIRDKRVSGIILRAKAKWKVEGEKSTRYFCNLEKRHYTEKLIPKLIVDGKELISQEEILSEQRNFYYKLYSSKCGLIQNQHENSFFNNNNPFITKLTAAEGEALEGPLTRHECLQALKIMKNNKSPGMDGYTVEFYKFFWNDLNSFIINSLNFAYEKQELSVTQKQGLITCIPKDGKTKTLLKNWRPISLLSVDTKLASAAIASRIKKVLDTVISDSQAGFIKGRYIGDCNRLVYDLIKKAKAKNIPGLLILLDFEKAFDSLEWNFIEKTLSFFGFGNSIQIWFKTFYKNISSCILNNGHISDPFYIRRGVRQGDPLSPYLFILSLELLSAAVKYDPNISGIQIGGSEYLISQYADDSSLLLGDDVHSLNAALTLINNYSKCSGLKVNFEKTQAVWFGSKRGCGEELETSMPLIWKHNGKFKLLGIEYNLSENDITSNNFKTKIQTIKNLLNDWAYRDLTVRGKITVIKSLAIPIITQCLTVLNTPSVETERELEKVLYQFIWNKKPDKIKRKTLINQYEEGGLKMIDLKSFSAALKMSWLRKIKSVDYTAHWKTLLIDTLENLGGDKFLHLPKEGLEIISIQFNAFWQEVIAIWASIQNITPTTPDEILLQTIWYNKNIKIENKMIFKKSWVENSIYFINDLINDKGEFLSYEEFSTTFNIRSTFLEYYGIINAIPVHFKTSIQNANKLKQFENKYTRMLKGKEKTSKLFYNTFIEKIKTNNFTTCDKWSQKLNAVIDIDNWKIANGEVYKQTDDSALQMFHYKVLNRILYTNRLLYRCNMKETELCSFCGEHSESISHLLFDCSITKSFLLEVRDKLLSSCNIHIQLDNCSFILGMPDRSCNEYNSIYICILLCKKYVYICKIKNNLPTLISFIEVLRYYRNIDMYSRYMYSKKKAEIITNKWHILDNLFH